MKEPVRSVKNQYRGVNAHLQSYLQGEGDWPDFHTTHIVHLAGEMKTQLLPMGYTAAVQQSLQIRRHDQPPRYPESDITVYDTEPYHRRTMPSQRPASTAELVLSVPAVLQITEEEMKQYRAIVLYEIVPGSNRRGEAVAWIELLSPSNKPGGQDAQRYRVKRENLLQTGLVFVEIDYLHESPPAFGGVADYTAGEPGAHPYRIMITDPRPVLWDGQAYVRQFDVDEPIPALTIPLSAGDEFEFDFDLPYHKTFETMVYGNDVNYCALPPDFDTYSEADRARIVRRMLAVLEAAARGEDLERGGFAVDETVSLAEALARLEAALPGK
ncbi:MAG: DUF4058 family protein [Anaerolineae bacterium]|nr:DUF4058 family protein [Anaerolineae bacterium]